MSDLFAPLIRMFDGVGLPWEKQPAIIGREMPDNLIIGVTSQPMVDPVEWLQRNRIPIRRTVLGPNVNGQFVRNGEELGAVELPQTGGGTDAPSVRHTLWHEIGHVIDFIAERDEQLFPSIEGLYSTKHKDVLLEHAELIVALRMKGRLEVTIDNWSEYARKPEELWAELVALACTNVSSVQCAAKLWSAVHPDLVARRLPVPELKKSPAEELAEFEAMLAESGQ